MRKKTGAWERVPVAETDVHTLVANLVRAEEGLLRVPRCDGAVQCAHLREASAAVRYQSHRETYLDLAVLVDPAHGHVDRARLHAPKAQELVVRDRHW